MKEKEFLEFYWRQYLLLEKEFNSTTKYVAIDDINRLTYSDAYLKLMLQIGSEIDVVAKKVCFEIVSTGKPNKINQYQSIILNRYPEFSKVAVFVKKNSNLIIPWDCWDKESPIWWKAYNSIKHNRNDVNKIVKCEIKENYKLANQINVLSSLAALYQMEQYLYLSVDHRNGIETPLPGSRLFILKNFIWDKMHFGEDQLIYLNDEGDYIIWNSDFSYHDI